MVELFGILAGIVILYIANGYCRCNAKYLLVRIKSNVWRVKWFVYIIRCFIRKVKISDSAFDGFFQVKLILHVCC